MDDEGRAFIAGAKDAVRRVIADLRQKAETAEQLHASEHRAFMAEQREVLAQAVRRLDERVATVRDGVDGVDGKDGRDGLNGQAGRDGRDVDPADIEAAAQRAVSALPVPKDGADGVDGRDGKDGADGINGTAGLDGAPGSDGSNGAPGRDGIDGLNGRDGADGADGVGLAEALIDRDGNLVVTLTNGTVRSLGAVHGRDGVDGHDGANGVAGDQGEPGRAGEKGDRGEDAYPGTARGKYDPDAEYRALDTVGHNGSEWRAKRDDPGPLPGDGWMLSACVGKRGERGERGGDGRAGVELVAGYVEDGAIVLTRSDGGELKINLAAGAG